MKREVVNAINKYNRPDKTGLFSLPYRLPALVSILPAYLAHRLIHHHTSQKEGLIVVIAIYLGFQVMFGFYLRFFLRKHPDLKWQILIR